jgi:serine/threonine protein kinase
LTAETTNSDQSRNPASDIWSLGCVFIEMSTVLMNRTIQELRKFYEENGTKGHYVRDNLPGTDLWIEQLKLSASIKADYQPVDLGRTMCSLDSMGRPTASELVSEILDLKGPPAYFGFCCDRDNDTGLTIEWQEPRNHLLEYTENLPGMLPETIVPPVEQEKTETEVQSWPLQLPTSSYLRPSVEEVDDNITLRILYPEEGDLLADELVSIVEGEDEASLSHSQLTGGVPEAAGMTTSPAGQVNILLQKQFLFSRWPANSLRR